MVLSSFTFGLSLPPPPLPLLWPPREDLLYLGDSRDHVRSLMICCLSCVLSATRSSFCVFDHLKPMLLGRFACTSAPPLPRHLCTAGLLGNWGRLRPRRLQLHLNFVWSIQIHIANFQFIYITVISCHKCVHPSCMCVSTFDFSAWQVLFRPSCNTMRW